MICSLLYQIANWVADSVLIHEDSRKRSAILKQFISVADVSGLLRNLFAECLLPSAMSLDAQLLEYGCYSIWTELASYKAPQALMGASKCATYGST
jgi:hypothetical protein